MNEELIFCAYAWQRATRTASWPAPAYTLLGRRPCTLQPEPSRSAGVDLLNQFGVADCSYDLTPEQLHEKVAQSDALVVRSGTKVSPWGLDAMPNVVGAT